MIKPLACFSLVRVFLLHVDLIAFKQVDTLFLKKIHFFLLLHASLRKELKTDMQWKHCCIDTANILAVFVVDNNPLSL